MESKKKIKLTQRPIPDSQLASKIIELYSKYNDFFLAPFYFKDEFNKFLNENEEFKELNQGTMRLLYQRALFGSQTQGNPAKIFQQPVSLATSQQTLDNYQKLIYVQYEQAVNELLLEGKPNSLLSFFKRYPEFLTFIYDNASKLEEKYGNISILEFYAQKFNAENPQLLNEAKNRFNLNHQFLATLLSQGDFTELVEEAIEKYNEQNKTQISADALEENNFDIESRLEHKDYVLENDDFVSRLEEIIKQEIDSISDKQVIKKTKLDNDNIKPTHDNSEAKLPHKQTISKQKK